MKSALDVALFRSALLYCIAFCSYYWQDCSADLTGRLRFPCCGVEISDGCDSSCTFDFFEDRQCMQAKSHIFSPDLEAEPGRFQASYICVSHGEYEELDLLSTTISWTSSNIAVDDCPPCQGVNFHEDDDDKKPWTNGRGYAWAYPEHHGNTPLINDESPMSRNRQPCNDPCVQASKENGKLGAVPPEPSKRIWGYHELYYHPDSSEEEWWWNEITAASVGPGWCDIKLHSDDWSEVWIKSFGTRNWINSGDVAGWDNDDVSFSLQAML